MSRPPRGGPTPVISVERLAEVWRNVAVPLAAFPVTRPGFRLFWHHERGTGFRDFGAGLGTHFIVGAHSLADVVLGGDADVSQRHLLVLTARTPSGSPALRLLDLRARSPMFLDDDRPHRSLRVHGAFALRLGSHVLGGFPLGDPPPPELPAIDLAGDDEERSGNADVSRAVPRGTVLGHHDAVGPYRSVTRIEALKRPSTLVEVASTRPPRPSAMLLARRAGIEARVPLSQSDAAGGILIGRAERCLDAGLRHVMTMTTSRIHAILIGDPDGSVHLLDAASTNGTFVDGTRVRSALLGPGAQVRLGTDIDIELRPA